MDNNLVKIIGLVVVVVVIAGTWKVFQKAGQPGWGALVPIFNVYLMTKIAGRPAWWLLLMLIPVVNLVVAVIMTMDISKSFGHGVGYALGLIFLPVIFYPMLGFGADTYTPRTV